MQTLQAVITILGRIMLAGIFLMSAIGNKIPQFNSVAEYMTSKGVPAASLMLIGAIVFLVVGGLSIVLGYKARIGAALLFTFLVLATYFFHNFWSYPAESPEHQKEMIQFMKNLALMGAMLIIFANGSGAGSLDRRATFAQKPSAKQD